MLQRILLSLTTTYCLGFHVSRIPCRIGDWNVRRNNLPFSTDGVSTRPSTRQRLSPRIGSARDNENDDVVLVEDLSFQERQEYVASNFSTQSVESIQKSLVRWGQWYSTQNQSEKTMHTNESLDDTASVATIASPQKVPGCIANVHIQTFISQKSYTILRIQGTADAQVSRGLLAIWARLCQGVPLDDILALDPTHVAEDLALRPALSVGRNDGLASLVRTTQQQIRQLLDEETPPESMSSKGVITSTTETLHSNDTSSAPTVALLLSGGVDSSVALNLLHRQGYNVTAFYLKIWLEDELAHLGQCPWEDDYRMCRAVTDQIGVPLEAISLQEEYRKKVISYTIEQAEQGRTPNPDIMCNSRVKFGCFYDAIAARDFDYVATGHYAQLTTNDETGQRVLRRAPDPVKDQTYFLCALTQEQLRRVLFPIGHLLKSEVRDLAEEYLLPNRNRPDSQGLCFLGKVKFDEFLSAYLGERPGPIIDAATGDWLGEHRGVWYHTVGQRRGIGKVLDPLATSRGPWYVVAKDPSKDIVYCSNQYDGEIFDAPRSEITVENLHWIANAPPQNALISIDGSLRSIRLDMKIRHGPRLVNGLVTWDAKDPTVADVRLNSKDGGLAPGQFVVMYLGDECLGGGIISEKHWAKFLSASNEDHVAASTLV